MMIKIFNLWRRRVKDCFQMCDINKKTYQGQRKAAFKGQHQKQRKLQGCNCNSSVMPAHNFLLLDVRDAIGDVTVHEKN